MWEKVVNQIYLLKDEAIKNNNKRNPEKHVVCFQKNQGNTSQMSDSYKVNEVLPAVVRDRSVTGDLEKYFIWYILFLCNVYKCFACTRCL